MVGYALRKIAKENDMKIANGVVYGVYKGYAVTLSEGAGYKLLGISAKAPESDRVEQLLEELNGADLQKKYRIMNLNVAQDGIIVEFHDNPGTMKCFFSFVEWFFPLLQKYGYPGSGYCARCGQVLDSREVWVYNGVIALHLHEHCAAAEEQEMRSEVELARSEDTGSYSRGFAGALVGALIGAVPWAAVLYFGYFAAVMGLLIGFLALKGYDRMHGKMGKGKLVIIALTSLIGVAAGNLMCDAVTIVTMLQTGEIYGVGLGDFWTIFASIWQDAEYVGSFIRYFAGGSFFVVLGIGGMLMRLHREDPTWMPKTKKLK